MPIQKNKQKKREKKFFFVRKKKKQDGKTTIHKIKTQIPADKVPSMISLQKRVTQQPNRHNFSKKKKKKKKKNPPFNKTKNGKKREEEERGERHKRKEEKGVGLHWSCENGNTKEHFFYFWVVFREILYVFCYRS